MTQYQLADRTFSRAWRRNKRYSSAELRWLAHRRGLEFNERRGRAQVTNPQTGKVVANLVEIVPAMEARDSKDLERKRVLAALVLGKATNEKPDLPG